MAAGASEWGGKDVTLQTKGAALGPGMDRAARGQTQRGGRFVLPDPEYTPGRAKAQTTPPGHLTPHEATLWAVAEAARSDGDRQGFFALRRAFLLEQSRRYRPAR